MGASVDSTACLAAWSRSLGDISYPLLSDFWPHGHVAQSYGVLRSEGYSERAIFLVDRDGVIRYIDVHAIDEMPDPDVLMRELEALASGQQHRAQASLLPAASETPAWTPSALGEDPGALFMYCTPWCPDCMRARNWLRANGIPYVEIDVSTNAAARERAAGFNHGRLHTPTFECRGRVVVDFADEDALRGIIN